METDRLYCIFKHCRFLGSSGVNLRETEAYTGRHGRAYHWQRGQTKDWSPSERGGYTLCYLKVKDEVVAVGLGGVFQAGSLLLPDGEADRSGESGQGS